MIITLFLAAAASRISLRSCLAKRLGPTMPNLCAVEERTGKIWELRERELKERPHADKMVRGSPREDRAGTLRAVKEAWGAQRRAAACLSHKKKWNPSPHLFSEMSGGWSSAPHTERFRCDSSFEIAPSGSSGLPGTPETVADALTRNALLEDPRARVRAGGGAAATRRAGRRGPRRTPALSPSGADATSILFVFSGERLKGLAAPETPRDVPLATMMTARRRGRRRGRCAAYLQRMEKIE